MRRILIIGNSHTGALKESWDADRAAFPGTEIAFFVAPQNHFAACRLGADRVFGLPEKANPRTREIVRTLNDAESVDLKAFDVVVRVGYRWRVDDVVSILAGYDIDGILDSGAPRRMSAEGFRAACCDIAGASLPGLRWRDMDRPRLVFVAKPYPSEAVLETAEASGKPLQERRNRGWRLALGRHRSVAPALAVFEEAMREALAACKIDFVPAPAEARGGSGLTLNRYTLGSARLSAKAHGAEEIQHMNRNYGALVLREVMTRVGFPAPVA
jgi:hypothetical protein